MEFTIRHQIPGRIRIHAPALRDPSPLAESILSWLEKTDGVDSARMNYHCASMIIEYDPAKPAVVVDTLQTLKTLNLDNIQLVLNYLDPTGRASLIGAARGNYKPPDQRSPLALPSVSLALAFSASPLAVVVNVPLMFYCAFPIFKRAWGVWRNESRLNVDFLDTLAISASMAQGNFVAGGIITWLIRLGDWIRDLTAAGSKRAVSELLEFQSKTAWLVIDGVVTQVPAIDLACGDIVVVYTGEMIPVDGEIVHGHGMIDQKTITGEGLPVARTLGGTVFAATILREGQITVRTQRAGSDTTAGQIAKLVDSAPIGDTRLQNHAELFADRLVLPMLALAIGTSALTRDFNRFLSLIIVDYGTGIRVAAPTAVLSSITQAARSGIIIKSGGHMEKLAAIDTVVFDKTGTLSHGTPHVVSINSFIDAFSKEKLLGLAVAAETHLQHPVAEALRAKAKELEVIPPPCDETEYRIGLGVEGQVGDYYLQVGSERFLRQCGIATDHVLECRTNIDRAGHSCLYVAIDRQLAGLIAYEDQIRPESREVIEMLHSMGIRDTIMLTGDNATVAEAVSKRLGLTRYVANMMPADKADVIQSLQEEGRIVAMIGDGINDSPALSYADVGIAMKHGADITHESADVVLMEDSLWRLVKAMEISRAAVDLIKQNYGIVAVLNTAALGLVLPGNLISPEMTALISNGSAIIASFNGLRPLIQSK